LLRLRSRFVQGSFGLKLGSFLSDDHLESVTSWLRFRFSFLTPGRGHAHGAAKMCFDHSANATKRHRGQRCLTIEPIEEKSGD
jgi:hypothetical protein